MSTIDPAENAPLEPAAPAAATPAPAPAAPQPYLFAQELVALARYVYNHNPFYPLSAVLVLLGLHSLFHDEHAAANITEIGFNNAVLWGVLAGYATLLAATSIWIVRSGKVWDDARTILLTLVLLLVALSINCDKPISLHVPSAPWLLLGGLAFVVLLAESTLRLTRIRLPLLLRAPMYLCFALFFLYPVGLDYCLHTIGATRNALGLRATLLGVLLFPTAAAVVTLSLLPAAIRGPELVRGHGTPWSWPCFPWSLFVALAVAVVLRSFYLTISFHPRHGMESAFAPYFLTPFACAVAAVVFELGRSVGHRATQQFAMAAPLAWLPLSLTGAAACDHAGDFLCLHLEVIGAPLQVTVGGLLLLYGYGWLRRGPEWLASAFVGLVCLAAVVGPQTVDLSTLTRAHWGPLATAAALCGWGAWRRPLATMRWFGMWTLGVLSLTVAGWETSLLSHRGAIPIHLWLAGTLALSVLLTDRTARMLRQLVAVLAVALAFGVSVYSTRSWYGLSPVAALGYVSALTAVMWLAWSLRRSVDQLTGAIMLSVAEAVQVFFTLSSLVRDSGNPRGWGLLLAGAACFAAGLAVSWRKMRTSPSAEQAAGPA